MLRIEYLLSRLIDATPDERAAIRTAVDIAHTRVCDYRRDHGTDPVYWCGAPVAGILSLWEDAPDEH